MTSPAPAATSPPFSRAAICVFSCFVGVLVALVTTVACSWRSYPVVPPALVVQIQMPRGIPGLTEPLVVTGRHSAGDLLCVRYVSETSAVFTYDAWGHGGPTSRPFDFTPGATHALRIEMPTLVPIAAGPQPNPGPLRLSFDDHEQLRAAVAFHPRRQDNIYFGTNPIHGSATSAFRGKLTRPNGRVINGTRHDFHSSFERVGFWVRKRPSRLPLLGALAAATALLVGLWAARYNRQLHAASRPLLHPESPVRQRLSRFFQLARAHACFLVTAGLLSCAYAWLVTFGTFTFTYPEIFGSFYDYQAESFLAGRLDVPEEAIGDEAFEARGKFYGYFGPTPALLRLPFNVLGVGFGALGRGFMLLYFVATLLAAYQLLRDTTARLSGPAARPSAFSIIVLLTSVGLGSTVFFLGSRAFIFHEAILSGIAFAAWSAWFALRHGCEPDRRWWLGALGCGVLSLHCRPPTGLFALTLLGCVTVALLLREFRLQRAATGRWLPLPSRIHRHLAIGALCILGQLSLNGFAWLKFRTFDPAPLAISRPYKKVPDRLVHIRSQSFRLGNVGYNAHSYLLYPNLRIEPRFPWIYWNMDRARPGFPAARLDLVDYMVPVTYSMPSLFALATLGSFAAALARPRLRAAVLLVWLAVLPMSLALFAAVATAQRYTGDFVPFLLAAAALGLAALDSAVRALRFALQALLVALTLAAVAVTAALTLHYQGHILWGAPEDAHVNYRQLRQRIDAFFNPPPPALPPVAAQR